MGYVMVLWLPVFFLEGTGQRLKFMYLLYRPNGGMKLYHFISIFGGMTMLLAQMPSFHSLRHINLVSIFLCLAYSTCATAASVHIGHSKMAPTRDYSVNGNYSTASEREDVQGIVLVFCGSSFNLFQRCYIWILGFWKQSSGNCAFFMEDMLLPRWFLVMINAFTHSQVSAVTLVYLQPTNEVLEKWCADPKEKQFAARNVVPRLLCRTLAVIGATFLTALLPFFGDIMALFGAFACIPLNFILPMIFYISPSPPRNGAVLWIHRAIVVVSLVLVAVGVVASVRQIVRDVNTYSLFANV